MKIPRDCTGPELVRALRKFGYSVSRQSGSHITMTTQRDGEHHATIPNHRFVRTPISSQRSLPLKTPKPKSNVTANRPLTTTVLKLVSGPATTLPGTLVASYTVN